MRIEIIAIGSELVAGVTIDTNSAMMAKKLRDMGIEVTRVTLVSDVEKEMEKLFLEVFKRVDVVIVAGGLGPTQDDRTRFAAAKIAGVDLVEDTDSVKRLREIFKTFGREMPKSNIWQAMFPDGAEILENPVGTARGFAMEHENCLALFGPGVPREMEAMADLEILPMIKKRVGITGAISTTTLHCFGLPESELADRLWDFEKRFPKVELAYSAKFPSIDLRLSAKGETDETADALLLEGEKYILRILGDRIFAKEGKTMAKAAAEFLTRKNLTMAIAESCTGGMIAAALTDIPGSTAYFLEGAVTYTNEAKIRNLEVRAKTLANHGAVSKETAIEMAKGIKKHSGADVGLSVTGIAGPDGGTPDKPVGTVHMALVKRDGRARHWVNRFPGGRKRVRALTVFAALDRIRMMETDEKSPLDAQFNCTD